MKYHSSLLCPLFICLRRLTMTCWTFHSVDAFLSWRSPRGPVCPSLAEADEVLSCSRVPAYSHAG